MPVSTSLLIVLITGLGMGCASMEVPVPPMATKVVPAEIRLFTDDGTVYYNCMFDPVATHFSCNIAPGEPNQPRCL